MATAAPLRRLVASPLLGLTVAAFALALGMGWSGRAGWLEVASFLTGAICVWLTVVENIWNFPIGLVNAATYCVVFFHARLYADAGLQVVYFVLGGLGWAMWLKGGEQRSALRIAEGRRGELLATVACCALATIVLWRCLRLVGGSSSFWDALTSSFSLGSQWLLNRKLIENWLGWILVDAIYVPLYLSKGLALTAILYAVFLAMAVMGYRQWRTRWRSTSPLGPGAMANPAPPAVA
jgi:nicotinamide mononucleotide transporter